MLKGGLLLRTIDSIERQEISRADRNRDKRLSDVEPWPKQIRCGDLDTVASLDLAD